MAIKKKIFPKLKKKLKGFLTDESGKISKKDALGLSVGAILFSGLDEVSGHNNITSSGSVGTLGTGHASAGLTSANDNEGSKTGYSQWVSNTCNHSSGIVNGHYSSIANVTEQYRTYETGHGSHGSHGSGGWC